MIASFFVLVEKLEYSPILMAETCVNRIHSGNSLPPQSPLFAWVDNRCLVTELIFYAPFP